MPPEGMPAAPVAAPVSPTEQNSQSKPSEAPQQAQSKQSVPGNPTGDKPQTAAELFDVMMNGKAEKWTKEKVLAHASKSAMADKKFEEAAQIRKENQQLREMAKKDPIKALLDPSLGLTKDQLRDAIENYYNQEYIEPEGLTPEQLELKRFREDAKQREETAKEQKAREEAEALEKSSQQYRESFQKQIIQALDASGLPKTAFFATRMAFHMQQNMQNGWDAPQELIIEQVKNEHNAIFGQMAALPAEEIIKVMGDEFINKIRAYDLKKLRESRGNMAPSFTGRQAEPVSTNDRKKVDMSDVNENFRKMKQGIW